MTANNDSDELEALFDSIAADAGSPVPRLRHTARSAHAPTPRQRGRLPIWGQRRPTSATSTVFQANIQ